MARVFITGSSDGLGQMAAQLLIEQGHGVVLHARSEQRGEEALAAVPEAPNPDFLCSLVESRSLVRLSVKKAAYADLSRAASRKSGGAPHDMDAAHRTQV
jgi:NAD(P)-dependent dehydrogenase (short-subunit alcohol dehydrogenase family)